MSADDLTPSEILVLLALMAESRPVTNTELKALGPELRADSRKKLNRLKLVETDTRARPFTHELADGGWARCYEELAADVPPRSNPAARTLYTMLRSLRRHFDRHDLRPADVFLTAEISEDPAEPEPARSVSEGSDLEDRIRAAYARHVARPGAWIGLADLRSALADVAKDEIDRALVRMYKLPDIHLVPEENQKMLTDRDRAAAVVIGNQDKHALAIEAP